MAAGTAAVALAATGVAAASTGNTGNADGTGAGGGRSPVVATAGGLLRGTTAGSDHEFLGIPYAAPPVGNLRWRAPQPAARWHGVRAATSFAPHCPQPGSPFG
ncbi:MAG TPA: carboxylesterase family protein, partial [Streptosporangiaceae bacterium]